MTTNLEFGDSVIINGEKVGTIVGKEKDGLVPVDYFKINKNKEPLALPVIIYVNKNDLTIEKGKNQKGGTGNYESEGSETFHILALPEKRGINYALYGYFENNNLHLFQDSAPSVETGEHGQINYDKITDIIASVEFQDIIMIDNDIEQSQLASHFLEKIKTYYKIVKFSLNQKNIADATVSSLTTIINKACENDNMEDIFGILSETQLRKKTGKDFQITTDKRIDTFITNLTKYIGVGCTKTNLSRLFRAFCKESAGETERIAGKHYALNTHVDKIINAFLPTKDRLSNTTLLRSVTYTAEKKIKLDNESELGKLFNMKYDINEKDEITKATLSYNLIGFLMLMTELDHDFNDVKEIKPHLPTINKNFLDIATIMKGEIIIIDDRTEGNQTVDETFFTNTFGVLDKENPKLKEEEMGRIITAMISEDDMPRVIAADNRVYLQYYAPKSLKGNMPSFYNVGQINQKTEEKEEGNKIEQFLQYVLNNEDGKDKVLLSDFKRMIDIGTDQLNEQKKNKKNKLEDKKEKDIEKSSEQERILIEKLYNASIKALENRYTEFTKLKNDYDVPTFKPITKLALKAYNGLEIELEKKIKKFDNEYDASLNIIKKDYENNMSQSQDNTESQEKDDVSSIGTEQSQADKDFETNKKELFERYKAGVLNENKILNEPENLINKIDDETEIQLLQKLINEYNSKSDSKPFMDDIMSFYNTDIYFTSDADNKAAYVLANSKNMKPITKEKHPFLSLDAGSSPQLPINNEYYDYFNRLHNEDNSDPITPPTIVVKNPLNGDDLVEITYNAENKIYSLIIRVTEELKIEETIKDLNKTSMSGIMTEAIELYNNNIDKDIPKETAVKYKLLLFGASILKSLGDLVCYITVNMQEFLKSKVEDQENTMFLCNSADYSMFYPLLGNFSWNKDSSGYTIDRKYNKTNMYLSCSVKSTQNFFVPLTQHEQIKLYLIKLMYTKDARRFQLLEEVLSFQEKYGKPGSFNNKIIYRALQNTSVFEKSQDEESIALFTNTNYEAFKSVYQAKKEDLLHYVSEMYLIFVYLSKLYYFQESTQEEVDTLKSLLTDSKILNEIKVLNRDIFQEHTFDLNPIRTQWERLELIADYQVDKEGLLLNLSDKMRRDEILESFLFKQEVQFTDVEITNDGWKYAYLYATILKKVGDSGTIYNYLNKQYEEQIIREAAAQGEESGQEESGEKESGEKEKDNFAAESVNDSVTGVIGSLVEKNIERESETGGDYGGKRKNNSKKKGKKDKKRQTRKANN